MKVIKINLQALRNEEHYQFHCESKDQIARVGAATLGVELHFDTYGQLLDRENEALLLVRKSATTQQLSVANAERGTIYRGIVDVVKAALKHYNIDNRAAASRIKVLLDTYGNVPRKPYNEETAAIKKFIQEVNESFSTDIVTLGLTDWLRELELRNNAFDALTQVRYSEEAGKTEYRMKKTRAEVDATFRSIVSKVDALILVNGASGYRGFVRELNARIEKFNSQMAIRKGRYAKDDDTVEAKTEAGS